MPHPKKNDHLNWPHFNRFDSICQVGQRRHALLEQDRAGWHTSTQLAVPANITLLSLPSLMFSHSHRPNGLAGPLGRLKQRQGWHPGTYGQELLVEEGYGCDDTSHDQEMSTLVAGEHQLATPESRGIASGKFYAWRRLPRKGKHLKCQRPSQSARQNCARSSPVSCRTALAASWPSLRLTTARRADRPGADRRLASPSVLKPSPKGASIVQLGSAPRATRTPKG